MANVIVKPAARSLVVAPRLPDPPQGHPFQGDWDVVINCGVPGCGWNAMGRSRLMDKARKDHYRQYHATDNVAGLTWINNPTIRA